MKISTSRLARRVALSASTILSAGVAVPALAQLTPPAPVRQSVDANGVDLFLGKMNVVAPAVSVGSSDQPPLTYAKINRGSGWGDTVNATLDQSGSIMTASFNGVSDTFTVSGTTFTSTEGLGATLTLASGTYTYTQRDGTVILYSSATGNTYPYYASAGRATSVRMPSGQTLSYTYASIPYCAASKQGSNGQICTSRKNAYHVSSVQSSSGYKLTFDYAGLDPYDPDDVQNGPNFGQWSTIIGVAATNLAQSGAGTLQSASFSDSGSALTVYDMAGRSATYRYTSGQVIGIRRPGASSESVTVAYTGGRVSSVTNAAGTTTYSAPSDASGIRTVTVTNSASQPTTYRFNIASQRMTEMTNALNQTTKWEYDSAGRLTKTILPEQNYTQLSYDARGNVTSTVSVAKPGSGLANITTSASYPSSCTNAKTCNQPTSTTDARGFITDYTYDATHGGVLTVTAPAPTSGATRPQTRFGYTSTANSVTGEAVYLLTSTSMCQTASSCAGGADEVKTTIGYENGNLKPTSISTGAGDGSLTATTAVTYDAIGNVTSVDGPLAGADDTTSFTYDAARNRTGVLSPDPDGGGPRRRQATRVYYDGDNHPYLTEAGVADAGWANYGVVQQANASYDGYGRKTADWVTAGGTTYGRTDYVYDGLSRLQTATVRLNGAGSDRVTLTGYDAINRVATVTRAYGTGDQATDISNSYRLNGQLETVTDALGNRTTYGYDGFDRLQTTYYPVPTQGAQASNSNDYEQLTYDAAGNVTNRRLRDGNNTGYVYDNLNRLTAKNRAPLAPTYNVGYEYDNLGRMIKANGTNQLTFAYDALGRLTSETTQNLGANSWQYDIAGRMTRQTWTDGFYVSYNYLTTGAVSSIVEGGSGLVLASFGYDDLGRRTSLTRGNGTVTGYSYDPVSRLSQLTQDLAGSASDLTLGFGYNWAAQITSTTRSNDVYAWTGHANVDRAYGINGLNQMTTVGAGTLGYDGRGNLTSTGGATYSYSADNQLATGPGETLSYDNLDRLLSIAIEGKLLRYAGSAIITEQASSGGAIQARYVYGPGTDEALVWYAGVGTSDRRWLHADERGSIVAVSDASGNALRINTYDEYGVPGANNLGRFQYTGQGWLPTLGLYNYKARIYSSRLGRFMQTDPIGYGDGMNWYNYVGSDPINFTDPSGLDAVCGPSGNFERSRNSSSTSNSDSVTGEASVMASGRCHWNVIPQLPPDGGSSGGSNGGGGKAPQNIPCKEGADCKVTWPCNISNNYCGPKPPPVYKKRLFGTHWCGPGGEGPTTGKLDEACRAHDMCYGANGLSVSSNFSPFPNAALRECNQRLCDASRGTGTAGFLVREYFRNAPPNPYNACGG